MSPANEYSDWIFFRIDWFELRAVRRTLKILQHHNLTRINEAKLFYLHWSFMKQKINYTFPETPKTL